MLRHPTKREKDLVLSYAWYEELDAQAKRTPNQPMLVWITRAYREVYHRTPKVKVAEAIIARLEEESELAIKAAEEVRDNPPKKTTNHFGVSHTEWLRDITPEKSCLLLADFDIAKARNLYCDVDKHVVDYLIKEKTDFLWHGFFQTFEAVMYGFGNSYDGKSAGEVREFDLNNDDPPDALMRSMGLLQ